MDCLWGLLCSCLDHILCCMYVVCMLGKIKQKMPIFARFSASILVHWILFPIHGNLAFHSSMPYAGLCAAGIFNFHLKSSPQRPLLSPYHCFSRQKGALGISDFFLVYRPAVNFIWDETLRRLSRRCNAKRIFDLALLALNWHHFHCYMPKTIILT